MSPPQARAGAAVTATRRSPAISAPPTRLIERMSILLRFRPAQVFRGRSVAGRDSKPPRDVPGEVACATAPRGPGAAWHHRAMAATERETDTPRMHHRLA